MLLIGSRALAYYMPIGRDPYDWDFIVGTTEMKSLEQRFNIRRTRPNKAICPALKAEFYIADNGLNYSSDSFILEYCLPRAADHAVYAQSPFGGVLIPPIEVLKAIKLATVEHLDKTKHRKDLELLKDIQVSSVLYSISRWRAAEIGKRLAGEKREFFDKYDVKRVIDHDELHTYIADGQPAYRAALAEDSTVEIDEIKFNDLTEDQRLRIAREEVTVLALERCLIPRLRAAPHLVEKHIEDFLDLSTSATPIIKYLDGLSAEGKVKDHPDWLARWYFMNYSRIKESFPGWLKLKVHTLPTEFWRKVLNN